jgi:hypothetical protein
MEQDPTVLVCVHAGLAKTGAHLLGDACGGIGLDNSTIAAEQIESEQVGHRGAVGEAPSLSPARPAVSDLPPEFGKEPGLADPGFPDEADSLAAPVLHLPQEIIQNRQLAFAIDKDRRARRGRLAQPGTAVGNREQAISRDRLGLAPEKEGSDRLDMDKAFRQ